MGVTTSTKAWRDCTKAQLLETVEMLIEQRDKALAERDALAAKAAAVEARVVVDPFSDQGNPPWRHAARCDSWEHEGPCVLMPYPTAEEWGQR